MGKSKKSNDGSRGLIPAPGPGQPENVNRLVLGLNNPNPEVRAAAIDDLKEIGRAAVAELVAASKHGDQPTRHNSVYVLAHSAATPPARAALLEALKDQNVFVRSCAAWALGQAGSDSEQSVLMALTETMSDKNQGVRVQAAHAVAGLVKNAGKQTRLGQDEEAATLLVNESARRSFIGHAKEAVALCDEVVRRYGDRQDAAIAECVAMALVNKGFTLGQAGSADDELAAYDEVVRRYGDRQEAAIAERVAMALVNKGFTLGQAMSADDELAAYDEVVRRYGDRQEAAIAERVVMALVRKGIAHGQAGRADDALAAYDEVVRRYGDRQEAAIAERVAMVLVNKGSTLGRAGRADDELAAYGEVVRRYGDRQEAAIAERVAKALFNKGFRQGQAGRADDALATYDEVVRRYGDRQEAAIAEHVAMALVRKGIAHGQAGRADDELAAYDEVVRRYGDRQEAAIAEPVGMALVNKGFRHGQTGRADDELAAYDEVVRRYGDRQEAAIAERVAKALFNKGFRQGQAGRADDELAAYDEVVRRYGDRQEAAIAEQVAMALVNKGVKLGQAGRADEAVRALTAALHKGSTTRANAAHQLGMWGVNASQAAEDLINVLGDQDANVSAASAQALTKIGGLAVPSLITRATRPDLPREMHDQAKDIIKDMGPVAREELLRIVREGDKKPAERMEALTILEVVGIDPVPTIPVLIELFKAKGKSTQNMAVRILAKEGGPGVAHLVAALDSKQELIRWNAARTLGKIAGQKKVPEEELGSALEQAVLRLEDLHRRSLKDTPRDFLAGYTDQFLIALEAIAEFSPVAANVLVEAKKSLARAEKEAQFLRDDRNEPINRVRPGLDQKKQDRYRQEPPDGRPEEDEQISRAAEKIDKALKELQLPPERWIEAKAVALMAELPVDKGYDAFEAAQGQVEKAIKRALTPRFGEAMTHHLTHRMRHGNYQDKKSTSAWANRILREHKYALSFPGSGEPSNFRAVDTHSAEGGYCIERREDCKRTKPQELEQLLPMLRWIYAGPRKRATKEEMEQRTMAERERERRQRNRSRSRDDL